MRLLVTVALLVCLLLPALTAQSNAASQRRDRAFELARELAAEGEFAWTPGLARIASLGVDATPALVELLGHSHGTMQALAARTLRDFGRGALPALRAGLSGEDSAVRMGACFVLADLDLADDAAEELLALLDDPARDVQTTAALALAGSDSYADVGLERLADAIEHGDAEARLHAIRMAQFLADRGRALAPALVRATRGERSEIGQAAAFALSAVDPEADAGLDVFIRILADGPVIPELDAYEIEARMASWRDIMREHGQPMSDDDLLQWVLDENADQSVQVQAAVQALLPYGVRGVTRVAPLLLAEDDAVKRRADSALRHVAIFEPRVLCEFVADSTQPDEVRLELVDHLSQDEEPIRELLRELLRNGDEVARVVAVASLGASRSVRALEALAAAREDTSSWVRLNVAVALDRIAERQLRPNDDQLFDLVMARLDSDGVGGEAELRAREDALVAEENARRDEALRLLVPLVSNENDAHILSEVVAILRHHDLRAVRVLESCLLDDSRSQAAWLLGELGSLARPALDGLREAAESEDPWLQLNALAALRRIDPDGDAVARLLMLALDREDSMPGAVTDQLASLGVEILPDLLAALRSEDPDLRMGAAWALPALGAEAAELDGPLREALDDESRLVRMNAAGSLLRLEPGRAGAHQVLVVVVSAPEDPLMADDAALHVGEFGAVGVSWLVQIMADGQVATELRAAAAAVLGAAGAPACVAVEDLRRLRATDNEPLSAAATAALERLDCP